MIYRIRAGWDYITDSLWFIPLVLCVGAAILAFTALGVDLELSRRGVSQLWWVHGGSARDAGDLLRALLTSLITITGLAISITMVVLTLAANQLGPRLIRSFMGDRTTQIALGLFIATIVYLLLVLRVIDERLSFDAVPRFAVTLATALCLLCVFVLLFFTHHVARSIVADKVVERVGDDLEAAILRVDGNASEPAEPPRGQEMAESITLPETGYVRAIDHGGLVRSAANAGAVLRLRFKPGDFLLPGNIHAEAMPPGTATDEIRHALARHVIVGNERTPLQDLEFSVRQLVEIALRALSPGINDPFTAIAAIDRLARAVAVGGDRLTESPLSQYCDKAGTVRVLAPAFSYEGFADTAFNQIRQAGASRADVLIRLLEVLEGLVAATRSGRRDVLVTHARLVVEEARQNLRRPYDLAAVEARFRKVLAAAETVGPTRREMA